MLIGYETFCGMTDSQFDTRISAYSFNYIQLQNGIYDEILGSNDIELSHSTDKKEWDFNTSFLATFNGLYECGNLQQDGQPIDSFKLKKRPKGTLSDWVYITKFQYNPKQTLYRTKDRLAFSLDNYEYALIPISQGIEGQPISNTVVCEFKGLFLVDKNESVKLFYNLEYGDIQHNRNINVIELIDSKYPMIYSTSLEYQSGSNSAVIVSDTTGRNGVNIDYLNDRKCIDYSTSILGNKKPKLLKDAYGRKKIVMLTNIVESPKEKMLGGLPTISFDWTEISDCSNTEDFVNNGLLEAEE